MRNVILNSERLILKSPIGNVNPEEILAAINYKETLQFLSLAPKNYSIENAKSFLDFISKVEDSERTLQLGVFKREDEQFIGMITLENIDHEDSSCELGYWISKPFTGKGIAFEGCRVLIEYAFSKLCMQRIEAFVIKEHIKSISLLERLGFNQIELLIDNEENDGVLVDRYKYSLDKR